MKKLIKIIVGLLAVLVLILLSLPFWIFPAVRGVANAVVPGKTQAAFHWGDLGFDWCAGRFHTGDLHLGNPEGYNYTHSDTNCVDFGSLEVVIEMGTVLSDVIHITSIDLNGLTVRTDLSGKNFRMILDNALGTDAGAAPEAAEKEEAQEEKPVAAETKEGGKKVVIDRLTLRGLGVDLGLGAVSICKIELTDIGKDSGGATWSEASEEIVGALDKVVGPILEAAKASKELGKLLSSDALETVSGQLGNAADAATEQLGKATELVKDVKLDGVKDALDGAGGSVKDAAGATGEALKSVTEGAGDALKDAGKSLKNLFK